MTVVPRKRQHCSPKLIDRLGEAPIVRALDQVAIGAQSATETDSEGWLQQLIHRCPELLPIDEIEPGFGLLIPVCMELPTSAGPVDNLFVTPEGNLVLVECKLWRNPEARREVVAQIMDYAQGMSEWSFEELASAVSRSNHGIQSIYEAVSAESGLTEERFVDAVTRNLLLGRVHLMIVGDGIRSSAEALAGALQRHPGFHFSLSLVELPIFRLPEGGYIVTPRVLARTVNIERGIVSVMEGSVRFEDAKKATSIRGSARSSISVEQGLEQLRTSSPETAELLERFVERTKERGIFLDAATKSLVLRWVGPEEREYALASVKLSGELITYNVGWRPSQVGHLELAHNYLAEIASLVGGHLRQTGKPVNWDVVDPDGKLPDARLLLRRSDEWFVVVEHYLTRLEEALKEE